jgi:hypothetical protein
MVKERILGIFGHEAGLEFAQGVSYEKHQLRDLTISIWRASARVGDAGNL